LLRPAELVSYSPYVFEEVLMRRSPLLIAVLAIVLPASARISLALEPGVSVGVSGKGLAAHVPAGMGQAVNLGAARPGFSTRLGQGNIGVALVGTSGGLNPGVENGSRALGASHTGTSGISGGTMNYVPGRSPTYIYIVTGTRQSPLVGSRGP
jgi:hypothetical protein